MSTVMATMSGFTLPGFIYTVKMVCRNKCGYDVCMATCCWQVPLQRAPGQRLDKKVGVHRFIDSIDLIS